MPQSNSLHCGLMVTCILVTCDSNTGLSNFVFQSMECGVLGDRSVADAVVLTRSASHGPVPILPPRAKDCLARGKQRAQPIALGGCGECRRVALSKIRGTFQD